MVGPQDSSPGEVGKGGDASIKEGKIEYGKWKDLPP